ncbi:MAG TPA: hypothetical protein VFY29_20285 [Terriglobia bacterium]|nr:hypothetical protein [Terriglobia bacterium]
MRFILILLIGSLALTNCRRNPAPDELVATDTLAAPDQLVEADEPVTPDEPLSTVPQMPQRHSPYVRIWVSQSGAIELNGEPADLNAVAEAVTALEVERGAVIYGRENPTEKANPTVLKVLAMVVEKQLPIRLSVRRDFADAVDENGMIVE